MIGTVIDQAYQLVRPISEGGMGTVYEAIQLRLDRRVAVKIMVSALSENPEALARFSREVKITSQLAHPHVVQLLDFGTTASNQPYLVTEYLEGEDLERRLARVGRLSLDATMVILRQVVSALGAIHARGIIHRDLKPANVFLLSTDASTDASSDFVKLVDFGISKLKTSTTQITVPSSVLGTPEYMPPEQASGRGHEVDHRSDQWALACMTWHMLSGQPPFIGGKLDELLDRIIEDDPPSLRAAVPDLPRSLESVLLRGLEKKQAKRFPTVSAFLRAFESAADG